MMNLLRLFESTFATYSGITSSSISSTYSRYMSPGPYKLYITLYYRNYVGTFYSLIRHVIILKKVRKSDEYE